MNRFSKALLVLLALSIAWPAAYVSAGPNGGPGAFTQAMTQALGSNSATAGQVLTKQSDGSLAFGDASASSFGTQTANRGLFGPTSGGAATPTFRALVAADLGTTLSPTFAGLTLTSALTYANGGTGQSTWARGDLLYASAANTLSKLTIGSTGKFLGTDGTDTAWHTISGTSNQVTVSNSSGDLTLSGPQDLATSSSPQFASLNLGGTDLVFQRDAAGILDQRNSTNAQKSIVTNTYTSTTSFERFSIDWQGTSNVCQLSTSYGSAGGSPRALVLGGSTEITDVAPVIYTAQADSAYAQASSGANRIGANAVIAGGMGSRFFTVVDYTLLSGKTVTITVNGTATTKTEAVNWTAATSNTATATSLASAISAISGVSATSVGAVVYVTKTVTTFGLLVATNAAAGGMTATMGSDGAVVISGGGSNQNPGGLFSLYMNSSGVVIIGNQAASSVAAVQFGQTSCTILYPSTGVGLGNQNDSLLSRFGTGVGGISNSTSGVEWRVYNTTDSSSTPSNSEYGSISWSANVCSLGTAKTGTGTARSLTLSTGGTAALTVNSSQVVSLTNALAATSGGTGQSSFTTGDILYASSSSALSKLAAGTSAYVLTSNGASSAPSWQVAPGTIANKTCLVDCAVDQSLTTGTAAFITFGNTITDASSMLGGSNTRVTIGTAGVYSVTAGLAITQDDAHLTGYRELDIFQYNSGDTLINRASQIFPSAPTGTDLHMTAAKAFKCAAGDYIKVRAVQASGSTQTLQGNIYTFLSVVLDAGQS